MGYFTDQQGQIFEADDSEAEALKAQGLRVASIEDLEAHNARQTSPSPAAATATLDSTAPNPVSQPGGDAGAPDAGAPDAGAVVPGYFVQEASGRVFQGHAEEGANLRRQGMRPATRADIEKHNQGQRYGQSFGDKVDVVVEQWAATGAELAEAASKRGGMQMQDPLTGQTIGPTPIDPLTGKTRPGVALEARQLTPFAYTPTARAKRAANPNTAAGAVVALDLATALLIPQAGVAGALGSAIASGAISEAGASAIDEDEFSVSDMGVAVGASLALEGLGAVALSRVFGKPKSYVDAAVDRARTLGADDALGEVDPVAQISKLQRNDEAVYERVQGQFDAAMGKIDETLVSSPETLFSPKTLKNSVSGNLKVQEDVFLDLAVKLEQAAEVLDTPGVTGARDVLKDALGKRGHDMFAAAHAAKRELEALGSESPLVQEAIEAIDGSLRSERTWGKAARTYNDTADDAGAVVGSWDVRDVSKRDALDARLDRARAHAAATGDTQLAKQVRKAERALEQADKVTGARLIADTTPDDIAALKKKIEGFEKRGPKLAKELSRNLQKLEKRLGPGSIPRATEDDALDYVAARVHGLGGGKDPLRDVLLQAERHVEKLKAKGASQLEIGRVQSEINALRAAADEVNDIPRAAKRVRDWEAHPSRLKEKAADEANAIATDEIENALQPAMHGGGAAIGGAIFGIPGYIGGYLLGRAANKRFGQQISRYLWNKAKTGVAKGAIKSPGTAMTGVMGAAAGMAMSGPKLAAVGYFAGRKAGELIGDAARGLFKRAKAAASEATPAPSAAPPAAAASRPHKTKPAAAAPEAAARTEAAAARKAAKSATDEYHDRVEALHLASQEGDEAARATAQRQLDELLRQGPPKRGLLEVTREEARQTVEAVRKRLRERKAPPKNSTPAARGVEVRRSTQPLTPEQQASHDDYWATRDAENPLRAADIAAGHARAADNADAVRQIGAARDALTAAEKAGDEQAVSAARRALLALVAAVRKDPGRALGAALAPGAAVAGSQAEGEGGQAAGAAGASAGLLLLFLPRGLGIRAARQALDDAVTRTSMRIAGAQRPLVGRAIGMVETNLQQILRRGVAEDWDADTVLRHQMQAVQEEFEARHVERLAEIEGAPEYVRAALWSTNGRLIETDPRLQELYQEALDNARATDAYNARVAREDAPPPSPRATLMDRTAELGGDQLRRLELDAEQTLQALPPEGRQVLRELFVGTGEELRELTRRFISEDPAAANNGLNTATDLYHEQMRVVGAYIARSGVTVPDELTQAANDAIVAELRRFTGDYARTVREAMPSARRAPSTPPELEGAVRGSGAPASSRRTDETLAAASRDAAETDARARARGPRGPVDPLERYNNVPPMLRDPDWARLRSRADDARVALGWNRAQYEKLDLAIDDAGDDLMQELQGFMSHPTSDPIEELIVNQREIVKRSLEGVGLRGVDSPALDHAIEATLRHWNATQVDNMRSGLSSNTPAHSFSEVQRQRRVTERQIRQDTGQLKNPDESLDEVPQIVDGIPRDAALRLDDALQPEYERLQEQYNRFASGHGETMLGAELPTLEEQTRAFVRDNPGLVSEEDALAYVRRRHGEIATDEGINWLEDGGYTRSEHLLPPIDNDAVYETMVETVEELADNGYSNTWRNLSEHLDSAGFDEREMRRAERIWGERESDLDEVWDRRNAPPSSEPDSAPPSSAPPSSDTTDVGLPDRYEMREAGLLTVHINNRSGIENVFGRELSLDEVRGIFSLDHLKKYADESDSSYDFLSTTLEVNRHSVEFTGKVGRDFAIQTTYRRGYDGLEIYYNFLHIPQELEGTGAAKKLIADMVKPLEDLGASEVTLSTAWVGQYAWPKLGARPDRHSEIEAFDAFERALGQVIEPGMRDQAVRHVMGKIDTLRDVADTWLPVDLVKDRMPELRLGWEDLMRQYASANVRTIPFEEACFRTSRSGNQQFLAGKYFLLTHGGAWNSNLSLQIAPGTPWYDEFKGRLGLAGVGAIGLGMWELMGAFNGTEAVASGIGRPRDDGDEELPPEVQAYVDQQRERTEKVESVRERLGYVKTQSQTALATAARALTSRMGAERTVAAVPGVTASRGVAAFLGSNSTLREAYEEKREALDRMQREPMALVEELTEGLSELEDTAPELHAQMVAQTYKIVQFLQQKLPGTLGTSLTRPRGAPPNDLALRQFALYYSAATEPGTVVADLANNRARREQVDTLREVWEPTYNQLKTALATEMASGRPTVAQRQRIDLLFDFGDALDTGLSSRLMGLATAVHAAGAQQAEQDGAPGKVPTRRTQPSVTAASATASLAQGATRGVA